MNRLFAISASGGGATAALIVILALLLMGHPKVPTLPTLPTVPSTPTNKTTPPALTPVTQPAPTPSGPFYFDLSQNKSSSVPINYTIFTPPIVVPTGSGTAAPPATTGHGSNITTIIIPGGGGGGGGGGLQIAVTENSLTANPSVIDLGKNTTLTQNFMTSPVTSDILLEIRVTLPNQDVCSATGLPATIASNGQLSKLFPNDFTLVSGAKGDKCDTSQAGTYNAVGQVMYNGKTVPSAGTFSTRFFVVPETPLGSIAVLISSLGAIAAFVVVKHARRGKIPTIDLPKQVQYGSAGGYCMKCREFTQMRNRRTVSMKNGRTGTRGVCSTCGRRMFKFGKGTDSP